MWFLLSTFILNYFGAMLTSSTIQPSGLLLCTVLQLEIKKKLLVVLNGTDSC